MILLVDLCYRKHSLSKAEFVAPIARIVKSLGHDCLIRHYTGITSDDLITAERMILCGTALKDNGFLGNQDLFSWIEAFSRPLLGICAGMEVIATAFGGTILEAEEIGMTQVRVVADDPLFRGKTLFEAYELHCYSTSRPEDFLVLAESKTCIQAMRHISRPVYGVMFHPEVRNEWVVGRFCEMPG
jgi:GMP synthase-like glutamine amidotransferase